MSLNFPGSPTIGQMYERYIWDGEKWVALGVSTSSIPSGTTNGFVLQTNGVGSTPTWEGFTQAGAAAVTRTPQSKARDLVSVKDFGAVGDGIANDEPARAAAEAAAVSVFFPAGTYLLTNPPTPGKSWGVGVCMAAGQRAYLHPYPGVVDCIYMTGFGLPLTSVGVGFNAAPLVQKAIDLGQQLGIKVLAPSGASMSFDTTVTIKQGRSASDTQSYALNLDMNGCTVYPTFAGYVFTIVPRCLVTDFNSGRPAGNVDIRNLNTAAFFNAACKAIRYGQTGFLASGWRHSVIENCILEGGAFDALWFDGAAKVILRNVTCLAGCGLKISASGPGDFCGDMVFTNFQAQSKTSGTVIPAYTIIADSSSGAATIGGIKFEHCTIYGPGNTITVGTHGIVGELWFTNTALSYEGNIGGGLTLPGTALDVYCAAGGFLHNLSFESVYCAGYADPAIRMFVDAAATTGNIQIRGGVFGLIRAELNGKTPAVIHFNNTKGVHVDGVHFASTTGIWDVLFDQCSSFSATNNTAIKNTITNGIGTANACNHYIITGNRMEAGGAVVIDNASGSTNKVVANNITVPPS